MKDSLIETHMNIVREGGGDCSDPRLSCSLSFPYDCIGTEWMMTRAESEGKIWHIEDSVPNEHIVLIGRQ